MAYSECISSLVVNESGGSFEHHWGVGNSKYSIIAIVLFEGAAVKDSG